MKHTWWMLRNSAGKPDSIFTFAVIAFTVVMAKFILSGATLTFTGHDISFGAVDAASIAAILSPTLGAYIARRYTDLRYTVAPQSSADQSASNGSNP